jgi:hypothetical protein
MNTIVSLEIAKTLKAEGFKKPTTFFYLDKDLSFNPKGLKHMKNGAKLNHNKYDEFVYSAPTMAEYNDWITKKPKHTEDDGN